MKKNGKTNWKTALTFAGSFMAFVIGSGYASGQEVMRFYTTFGYWGIAGEIISMALYSWLAVTFMMLGCKHKLEGKEALNYFMGKWGGKVIDLFSIVFIYTIYVLMISGAGATLNQAFGISTFLGSLIMIMLSLAVVLLGLQKLVEIIGCIGPVIGLFAIVVGVVGVISNFEGLLNANETISRIVVPRAEGVGNWLGSAVLAPACVLLASVPFLTGMGASTDNRKSVYWGGILGGVGLMTGHILLNIGMMANIERVYQAEVPSLALAADRLPIIAPIFSIILLLGMFTTAVPMLWSTSNRFAREGEGKFKVLSIFLAAIAVVGGELPFGELMGIIYPIGGYIGLLIMTGILYRRYINKGELLYQEERGVSL